MALTRVAFAVTVGNTGNSQATSSFTYNSGDLFLAIAGNDDAVNALTLPTFGGGTFSPLMAQIGTSGSNSGARAWTTRATSSGSGAVTGDNAGATTDWFYLLVWQFRGDAGTGTASTLASTALVVSNANAGTNSWVCMGMFDFTAGTAGVTGIPVVTNEVLDANPGSSHYRAWGGDWSGQSGTVSYGLNAVGGTPAGTWSKVAVEVRESTFVPKHRDVRQAIPRGSHY